MDRLYSCIYLYFATNNFTNNHYSCTTHKLLSIYIIRFVHQNVSPSFLSLSFTSTYSYYWHFINPSPYYSHLHHHHYDPTNSQKNYSAPMPTHHKETQSLSSLSTTPASVLMTLLATLFQLMISDDLME